MVTAKKTRKMPRTANTEKRDSFAVGVKPEHYWLITGMAGTRNVPRAKIMEEIIDHYIRNAFSKDAK